MQCKSMPLKITSMPCLSYMLVQRWRPNFINSATEERKVTVWIKVLELASELYNAQFLTRFADALGRFLKIHNLISIHSRGQFASIFVEVDLS